MVLFALLAMLLTVFNSGYAVGFAVRVAHGLRTTAYRKIQTLSFGNLDRFQTSVHILPKDNFHGNENSAIKGRYALYSLSEQNAALVAMITTQANAWFKGQRVRNPAAMSKAFAPRIRPT